MKASVRICRPSRDRRLSGAVLAAAIFLVFIVPLVAQSAVPASPKKDLRLVLAASLVSKQGHDAILPPHIAHLLGISPDETEVPVKQFVEMGDIIRGFEVSKTNQDDIVIFVEDRSKNESTFYLTAPPATVRKVLSVRTGVGYDRRPTVADRTAFGNEKKHWLDRLVPEKRPLR